MLSSFTFEEIESLHQVMCPISFSQTEQSPDGHLGLPILGSDLPTSSRCYLSTKRNLALKSKYACLP